MSFMRQQGALLAALLAKVALAEPRLWLEVGLPAEDTAELRHTFSIVPLDLPLLIGNDVTVNC